MSIDISTLNLIDYGIITIIFVSSIMSMLRGMTREFLGLLGWPIAIFSTYYLQPILEPLIKNVVVVDSISQALSIAIPFAVIVVLWFVIASIVSPSLKNAGLKSLDRWLGIFFGFLRGCIIVVLIYTVVAVVMDGDEHLPEAAKNSIFTAHIKAGAIALSNYAPEDIKDRITTNITKPENSEAKERTGNIDNSLEKTTAYTTDDISDALKDQTPNNFNLLEDEATSQ